MAGVSNGPSKGARRRPIISAINVTPMVDVMLILLVIMMVASAYIVAQTLKVELPRARTTDGAAQSPVTLTITQDGLLLWNKVPTTELALASQLEAAHAANPDLSLVISADREVTHGRVVGFIDLARVKGIKRFAINVEHRR